MRKSNSSSPMAADIAVYVMAWYQKGFYTSKCRQENGSYPGIKCLNEEELALLTFHFMHIKTYQLNPINMNLEYDRNKNMFRIRDEGFEKLISNKDLETCGNGGCHMFDSKDIDTSTIEDSEQGFSQRRAISGLHRGGFYLQREFAGKSYYFRNKSCKNKWDRMRRFHTEDIFTILKKVHTNIVLEKEKSAMSIIPNDNNVVVLTTKDKKNNLIMNKEAKPLIFYLSIYDYKTFVVSYFTQFKSCINNAIREIIADADVNINEEDNLTPQQKATIVKSVKPIMDEMEKLVNLWCDYRKSMNEYRWDYLGKSELDEMNDDDKDIINLSGNNEKFRNHNEKFRNLLSVMSNIINTITPESEVINHIKNIKSFINQQENIIKDYSGIIPIN